MPKRFGFLRFISGLYRVIGIILFVVGILGAVAVLLSAIVGGTTLQEFSSSLDMPRTGMMNSGILSGVFGSAFFLLSFMFAGLLQIGISEAILVFLCIEENTRATAALLARQK